MRPKVVAGREIMAPWLLVTFESGRRAKLHCQRCGDVTVLPPRSAAESFNDEREWRRVHRKCREAVGPPDRVA